MSLGRLLTAGRSLVGGNNSGVQYRMTSPKAMPKFGSAKNPFRSTASPEAASDEAPQASLVLPPAPPEQATEKRVESLALVAVRRAGKASGWLKNWSEKLSGWFSRSQPKLAKSAVPRFEKPPVQAELSLDRIKVVRNDLSDADLEIVPVRPAPGSSKPAEAQPKPPAAALPSGPVTAMQPVENAGTARTAWNRASRLFGAMKN